MPRHDLGLARAGARDELQVSGHVRHSSLLGGRQRHREAPVSQLCSGKRSVSISKRLLLQPERFGQFIPPSANGHSQLTSVREARWKVANGDKEYCVLAMGFSADVRSFRRWRRRRALPKRSYLVRGDRALRASNSGHSGHESLSLGHGLYSNEVC